MEQRQGVFVFVVCGAREHIDTLHFSLRYLRHFSHSRIVVVTDSARNEVAIEHPDIIEVPTPEHFNHHQASIYLKTGLHLFLPKGQLYCYLDTDVVAVNHQVDEVFNQYISPITFAPDHCHVRQFSPYAVNCGCKVEDRVEAELQRLINDVEAGYADGNPNFKKEQDALKTQLQGLNATFPKKVWAFIRYHTSGKRFELEDGFWYDKRAELWRNAAGQPLMGSMESLAKVIEAQSSFQYSRRKKTWYTADGRRVWAPECGHLVEHIQQEFAIGVAKGDWQHWNGGVFLFDDRSADFLQRWHDKTLHIFNRPGWRTRDQGTLIATVWETGLQNHPMLSPKWNYIADYYKPQIKLNEETGEFSEDNFKTSIKPSLVHVYHHFGTKGWHIWDWIERIGERMSVIPRHEGPHDRAR